METFIMHPADDALRQYIELRRSMDAGNDVSFEPGWLDGFTDKVNMPLHGTRIRFGMAQLLPWRRIDLHALAPSRESGMETLQLTARFDGQSPPWHLSIFDNGMSLRAEYSFASIADQDYGLKRILAEEYGVLIEF